jgi:hypothetical protein
MKEFTPIPLGADAELVLRPHEDGVRVRLSLPDCDRAAVMECMRGDSAAALAVDLHTGHEVRIMRGGPYSTSAVCELWRPAPLSPESLRDLRREHGYTA